MNFINDILINQTLLSKTKYCGGFKKKPSPLEVRYKKGRVTMEITDGIVLSN
jgi:hypothetical protein